MIVRKALIFGRTCILYRVGHVEKMRVNMYYKIWSSAYDSVLNMTKYKTAVAGEI